MKHLDDHDAIRIAEQAGGEPAVTDHLEQCARCQRLVQQYRQVLRAVSSAQALGEQPPLHLQRWASAYARVAAAPRQRWSLLPLLAQSAGPVAAVRGGELAGAAFLYGNEAHHLDLRIEPVTGGPPCLHGQLLQLGDEPRRSWSVTAVTADGATHATETGETGEFWIEADSPWQQATVVAVSDSERLVVRIGEGEPEAAE